MWQRPQTVYLALVVILMTLTLFFPFAFFPTKEGDVTFYLFGVSKNTANINTWFPYFLTVALSLALALFSITQFKNRKRQLNLGKINYLLLILTVAMLFVDNYTLAKKLGIDEKNIQYGIGMFLPVASFAFIFLANRGIKKDEELVKSVDRLR